MSKLTFANPWPSYSKPGLWRVLNGVSTVSPVLTGVDLPPAPVCVQPDFSRKLDAPRVMWLGHASCYVQLPTADGDGTYGILFDPVFSKRCSPSKISRPKRRMHPPCRVDELPSIDLVVISHDHYDHLDTTTLIDIERSHAHVRYLVPLGLMSLLQRFIDPVRITELGWWASHTLQANDKSAWPKLEVDIPSGSLTGEADETEPLLSPTSTVFTDATLGAEPSITVTCCPAQHNSGRSLFKRNKTQWASWYLNCELHDGDQFRIYFAGDPGYRSTIDGPVCPVFRDVASSLGPPDLALLPIAAGACLPFIERLLPVKFDTTALTRHIHCPPEDAVQVHLDLRARRSVGIHWGTFTTTAGARGVKAEFERVKVDGFDLCEPGVWLDVPLPSPSPLPKTSS